MISPLVPSGRSRIACLVAAALIVLGLGVPAIRAAAVPTPDQGPTAGGTSVSDVVPGVRFTQVSTGVGNSMAAVGTDGRAYAWGENAHGQLGVGDTTSTSTPRLVEVGAMPAGVQVKQVSVGYEHLLVLGTDGRAYATGHNDRGQLGDGTTTDSSTLVPVTMPDGVTFNRVEAGFYVSSAIASNGNSYVWGSFPKLLSSKDPDSSRSPAPVRIATPGGESLTQLAPGTSIFMAVTKSGKIYGWGDNTWGKLGIGVGVDLPQPAQPQVPDDVTFQQVSVSQGISTLALDTKGNVWSWGTGWGGVLGTGADTGGALPAKAKTPPGVTFTSVSAAGTSSLALASDGTLYGWGSANRGELGDVASPQLLPIKLPMPAGLTFTQVDDRQTAVAAIGSDGRPYTWGWGAGGQLGNGISDDDAHPTPTTIDSPAVVTRVLFGDTPGTGLAQTGDRWSVNAPAGCGVQDVTADYTQYGAQHSAVTKGGFTQGTAPQVTVQPKGSSVDDGATVTLSAAATGDDTPTVQWQQGTSAQGPWTDIAGATQGSLTLTPTATTWVRALFTNCRGSVASNVVELSLGSTTPTPTPTPSPDVTPTPTPAPSPSPTPSSSPTASPSPTPAPTPTPFPSPTPTPGASPSAPVTSPQPSSSSTPSPTTGGKAARPGGIGGVLVGTGGTADRSIVGAVTLGAAAAVGVGAFAARRRRH
ncbi:hypothetical protein FAM23869_001867 [Propionibacterium freudenreichii]|uniref:RCC1 domain-containing protein n=1 Tax=Propionibacterium freudenreichii TaxID=1744 RepID=UPI00130509A2|nr:hypothetical protein [Propionibacterium freudenreichii]MCQ1998111.1 hypothetical protein [Propionibacterium freudenreichii]MDK9298003.1 hypothetical protein [Propionibacterium freudenreichii]